MDITIYIAVAGVVIACGTLGWKVYDTLRDRPRVSVIYNENFKVHGGVRILSGNYDPTKTYFLISVINRGRRPVKIASIGYKTASKEEYHGMPGSECVLTELNPRENILVDPNSINIGEIEYVFAISATGKVYKKHYKN